MLSYFRGNFRQSFKGRLLSYSKNRLLDQLQPNNVIYTLIGTNIAIYSAWYFSEGNRKRLRFMQNNFTLSSYGIFKQFKFHTLLTSIFSHKDGMHLLLNMAALFFFGPEVAFVIGVRKFLTLYFGGGLASSLCVISWPHIVPSSFPTRQSQFTPTLGASGAVNAALTWFILTYPTRIIWFNLIIPVPAALAGIGFMLNDAYGLYWGHTNTSNIGHLGGAVFGLLYFLKLRYR